MDVAAGQLITDEIKNEIKNKSIKALPSNHNNSCFIDSCLVGLFYRKCLLVEFLLIHAVLQIETCSTKFVYGNDAVTDLKQRRLVQKTLKKFIKNMRYPTCDATAVVTLLRQQMSECRFSSRFNDNQQHDASEFLSQLFEILQLDRGLNKRHIKVYATNDLLAPEPTSLVLTTSRQENIGCLFDVHAWALEQSMLKGTTDSGILVSPLKLVDNREFFRTITMTELLPSLFFILYINRSGNKPNRSPVTIDEHINANGQQFELHAAVLHHGDLDSGHYTSLVKNNNGAWSLYNDSAQTSNFITFQTACLETNAAAHSICLIYVL